MTPVARTFVRQSVNSLLGLIQKGAARRSKLRRRYDAGSPVACCAEVLEARVLLTAGTIDASYGNAGVASISIPSDTANLGTGASVLQSDGKEVIVGSRNYWNAGANLIVSRFNTNGAADTTFGDPSGSASLGFATEKIAPNGKYAADIAVSANAVLVQSDGKILVAGSVDANDLNYGDYRIFISRFNANGTADTTFGSKGKAVFDYGPGNDGATDMVLTPQGKILLSVTATNSTGASTGASFLRLNANGSLDTTFGTNGLVTFTGVPNVTGLPAAGKLLLQASSNDPAGYEIILGSAAKPVGQNYSQSLLARFSSAGALDTSFGSGGITLTAIPFDSSHPAGTIQRGSGINGVKLQADGKIVVSGQVGLRDSTISSSTVHDAAVARFSPNGTLDTSFGNAGAVTTIFGTAGQYNDSAYAGLAIDANQNIVATGWWNTTTVAHMTLVRYTPGGGLDSAFGDSGTGIETSTAIGQGNSVNIEANGKLLVATTVTGRIVYNPPYTNYYPTIAAVQFNGNAPLAGRIQPLPSSLIVTPSISPSAPAQPVVFVGDIPVTVPLPVNPNDETALLVWYENGGGLRLMM